MDKCISLLVLFTCLNTSVMGQHVITGTVTDAETGQPLPGVNVYLANTTIGDGSDNDGTYHIKTEETGNYQLVFSFTGYHKKIVNITLRSSSSPTINASLKPDTYSLGELKVSGSGDEEWHKQFDIFRDQFIGETAFAEQTTIQNPHIIEFHTTKDGLIATAPAPLTIINKALGYKLYVELVKFEWQKDTQKVEYEIYPMFEALDSRNNGQQKQRIENRITTYLGSFTHFLKSLYNNTLEQHHFKLRWPSDLSYIDQGRTRFMLFEIGVPKQEFERYKGFLLDEEVRVIYENEIEYSFQGANVSLSIEKKNSVAPNSDHERFFVRNTGQLLDPTSLIMFDDWADDRIANTLPTNYRVRQ